MKIDLGCGNSKKKGYVGIDIFPGKQVDIVQNIENTNLPFKEGEIEEIYSNHVFEHFSLKSSKRVLKECYRVLQKDGILEIVVPSVEDCMRNFMQANEKDKWGWRAEYIWGNQHREGEHHKSGYTPERMKSLLQNQGFEIMNLEKFYHANKNICFRVIAKK